MKKKRKECRCCHERKLVTDFAWNGFTGKRKRRCKTCPSPTTLEEQFSKGKKYLSYLKRRANTKEKEQNRRKLVIKRKENKQREADKVVTHQTKGDR